MCVKRVVGGIVLRRRIAGTRLTQELGIGPRDMSCVLAEGDISASALCGISHTLGCSFTLLCSVRGRRVGCSALRRRCELSATGILIRLRLGPRSVTGLGLGGQVTSILGWARS